MADGSLLGGKPAPAPPRGTDVDALGLSDTSESGSDAHAVGSCAVLQDGAVEGADPLLHASTSDAAATGGRDATEGRARGADVDVLPDHVGTVGPDALDPAVSIDDPNPAATYGVATLEVNDAEDNAETPHGEHA